MDADGLVNADAPVNMTEGSGLANEVEPFCSVGAERFHLDCLCVVANGWNIIGRLTGRPLLRRKWTIYSNGRSVNRKNEES
jgi:hypothetical protein